MAQDPERHKRIAALMRTLPVGFSLPGTVLQAEIAAWARHEEDLVRLHYLIQSAHPLQITTQQIDDALFAAAVTAPQMYYELSAAVRTDSLIRFARALGLPDNALYHEPITAEQAMQMQEALQKVLSEPLAMLKEDELL